MGVVPLEICPQAAFAPGQTALGPLQNALHTPLKQM
jgi:hypothetical protein